MKKEFIKLQKENNLIREKLKFHLFGISGGMEDEYKDILNLIEELILNEIEQEKECNQ